MNRRKMLAAAGAATLLPALPASGSGPSGGAACAFAAMLRLGPVRAGAGNHRWAQILDGAATGAQLAGRVESGRLDWHVDPATGAVDATLHCRVLCTAGGSREVRARGIHAVTADQDMVHLSVSTSV
jgi:hypothetical protein